MDNCIKFSAAWNTVPQQDGSTVVVQQNGGNVPNSGVPFFNRASQHQPTPPQQQQYAISQSQQPPQIPPHFQTIPNQQQGGVKNLRKPIPISEIKSFSYEHFISFVAWLPVLNTQWKSAVAGA